MAEEQKSQTRRALAEFGDIYDLRFQKLAEAVELSRKGRKVIKGKDVPWQQGRHGLCKYYLYPVGGMPDVALNTMKVFVNEIRTHGGKHVHPGGVVIFVLRGKGYSVVDGIRHDWEKGDLLMLPIKPGGVEHQHFNLHDKPSRWMALRSQPLSELQGHFVSQSETHPDWKGELTP